MDGRLDLHLHPGFHVDVEPVSDRERKKGNAEPLEVPGWFLKEGRVISLQIAQWGCLSIQREGCSQMDPAHPHPWEAQPCLFFAPLHMGAEF